MELKNTLDEELCYSRSSVGVCIGVKGLYLVNLSTTTQMRSNPLDLGSPPTKSMVIETMACWVYRICSGCRRPLDKVWSALFLKQVSQFRIDSLTSPFNPCQKKSCFTMCKILSFP